MPSRTPAARQAPRVAAEKAARAETPLPGVWWLTAARTPAHGSMPVTGLSEPKASGTPWDANSANGFSPAARVGTEALRVHPAATAPQRVEIGLHTGDDAPRAELGGLLGIDHLHVFEPVPAPCHRGDAVAVHDTFEGVDNRGDRGITDDMEARRHPRLRACGEVGGDRVAVEVPVAAAVGCVVVRDG